MTFYRATFAALLLIVPQLAAAEPKPIELKGHTGWVGAVAFSPDSKTLASGGADNVVQLWDVESGKEKAVLKGHTDYVCAVAFSTDGKLLATGSYDQTAKIWDVDAAREHKNLKGHPGVVLSVAFLPEETALITGCVDGHIREWKVDPKSQRQPEGKKVRESWINSLVFARTGKAMATGSSDGTVRIAGFGGDFSLDGGAGEVRCVAFSPDGKLLAAGNRYGTVRRLGRGIAQGENHAEGPGRRRLVHRLQPRRQDARRRGYRLEETQRGEALRHRKMDRPRIVAASRRDSQRRVLAGRQMAGDG